MVQAVPGSSCSKKMVEVGVGGKKIYECAHTLHHHHGDGGTVVSVVATPVHPTGKYYLSAGSDGHLCYNDVQQQQEYGQHYCL